MLPEGVALPGEPAVAADGTPVWTLEPSGLVAAARSLRDHGYDYLSFITAVDRFPEEPRLEVVYELRSLRTRDELRLKVRVPVTAPRVPSVAALWASANWLEREVYDMFGVVFEDHPDLRRILLPDDYVGHPLRKDSPLGGEEVEFSQERPQ
ncbi:MAG: NADH-quinone oxidoreductase subunit C [Candidatus Dormibacteria bacterium]